MLLHHLLDLIKKLEKFVDIIELYINLQKYKKSVDLFISWSIIISVRRT